MAVAAAKSLADGWSRNVCSDAEGFTTGEGSWTRRKVRPELLAWYGNCSSSWTGSFGRNFWGGWRSTVVGRMVGKSWYCEDRCPGGSGDFGLDFGCCWGWWLGVEDAG